MRLSPCKGCEDRFVGCHDTCEKYQEWRHEKDAENRKIRVAKYEALAPGDHFDELWLDVLEDKGKE